jgi:ABC-type nitrate/sulfonate/bicarbonate transport system substrate-binding protein
MSADPLSHGLWYTHCPIPTATSIARALGWLDEEFARDGTAIHTLRSSPDSAVRDSHFTHTVANSFRHGGNIPPIFARSRGSDVRLIGLSWSDVRHPVLVTEDSPIRTPEDLRGRRLARPRRAHASIDFFRATALRTFERVLTRAGLSLEDVTWVDIDVDDDGGPRPARDGRRAASLSDTAYQMARFQREETLALVRGEIDAIASEAQVAVTLQAALGLRPIADLLEFAEADLHVNNASPAALTVSGALLDEHPEIVARWMGRIHEAARWARDHEDEAKAIMARESGLHEDFLDWAYSPLVHRQLDIDLAPEKLAALSAQHELLLEHGFIASPVDLEAFAAHEPLLSRDPIPSAR